MGKKNPETQTELHKTERLLSGGVILAPCP